MRIEGRIARNGELVDKIASGHLDLALAWDGGERPAITQDVATVPLCWLGAAVGGPAWTAASGEPLPLAVLETPCLLRTLACQHLDRCGLSWRVAFVSPSLGGMWAATAAGLGLALRTPLGRSASVRPLDPLAHGLPPLPSLGLVLHRADRDLGPSGEHLADLIVHTPREALVGAGLGAAASVGAAGG